jgi:hypothetical protein
VFASPTWRRPEAVRSPTRFLQGIFVLERRVWRPSKAAELAQRLHAPAACSARRWGGVMRSGGTRSSASGIREYEHLREGGGRPVRRSLPAVGHRGRLPKVRRPAMPEPRRFVVASGRAARQVQSRDSRQLLRPRVSPKHRRLRLRLEDPFDPAGIETQPVGRSRPRLLPQAAEAPNN